MASVLEIRGRGFPTLAGAAAQREPVDVSRAARTSAAVGAATMAALLWLDALHPFRGQGVAVLFGCIAAGAHRVRDPRGMTRAALAAAAGFFATGIVLELLAASWRAVTR